jgi:hypothetical protein
MPTMPEQPNMYEVSRSLRLMLEAPRKLARMFGRATEVVSGATEIVGGMQNPQVRRNAMRGLYYAAAQQEAQGGPFAPVAPVVRAAVRFSEPLEDDAGEQQPQRRIKIAPARQRPPAASVPVERTPAAEAPAAPPAETPAPVRRTLSVRRVEPPAETPAPPATPEAPARNPVRRIALNRSNAEPIEPHTLPVSSNGNGVHHND